MNCLTYLCTLTIENTCMFKTASTIFQCTAACRERKREREEGEERKRDQEEGERREGGEAGREGGGDRA